MKDAVMTDEEKRVSQIASDFLRFLAREWSPSDGFTERMSAMGIRVTPEALVIGKAMLNAAADQLALGRHLQAQEQGFLE